MDSIVKKLITDEGRREKETINLIPSENYVSKDVRDALGSIFVNKYSEGYPGARYYGGNDVVDRLERLACERALALFKLSSKTWHVNVQPYSGSPANMAVYTALVPVGGKIMGMRLDMGGHLTHGHQVSVTGKLWKQIPYGVDKKTEKLDYGALADIARREKPALVVAGFTAYSRVVDFKKMRMVADAARAKLLVDMSHVAGLVAGGAYPSPFPYADVVMTTTHKTLRGPRGAMIFTRHEDAPAIDKAVFPGLQGGPHENQIAAMAVAFAEALRPAFKKYARQVVKNAHVLARELQARGWRIISGGTDSHLMLIDTFSSGIPGKDAERTLEASGIVVNKNTVPFDTRTPFNPSGIRLGTPAITTRGFKEKDMKRVAEWIDRALRGENVAAIRKEIQIFIRPFMVP